MQELINLRYVCNGGQIVNQAEYSQLYILLCSPFSPWTQYKHWLTWDKCPLYPVPPFLPELNINWLTWDKCPLYPVPPFLPELNINWLTWDKCPLYPVPPFLPEFVDNVSCQLLNLEVRCRNVCGIYEFIYFPSFYWEKRNGSLYCVENI